MQMRDQQARRSILQTRRRWESIAIHLTVVFGNFDLDCALNLLLRVNSILDLNASNASGSIVARNPTRFG